MLSTSKTYTRYSSPSWISVIPIFPHLNHHSCRKYFRFFSSQLSPPPPSRMPTRSPSPPSRTSALPGSGIPRSESNKNFFVVIASSCSLTLLLVCGGLPARGAVFPAFWHGSSTFLVAGAPFPAFWNFSGLGGVFPAFGVVRSSFFPLILVFQPFGRYYLCREYGGGDFQPFVGFLYSSSPCF